MKIIKQTKKKQKLRRYKTWKW